jgi:hypothetical protein
MRELASGGNGDQARLGRVFEMKMAAGGPQVLPSIVAEKLQKIAIFIEVRT